MKTHNKQRNTKRLIQTTDVIMHGTYANHIYIYTHTRDSFSKSQRNGNIPLLISDLVAFFETPRTE